MTYFIAVANQKGGVAKTTTAVSLGGALAHNGKEVLLVDLDPQADLTLSLGVNPGKVRHAITDVLFNWTTPASVSQETGVNGLDEFIQNPKVILPKLAQALQAPWHSRTTLQSGEDYLMPR